MFRTKLGYARAILLTIALAISTSCSSNGGKGGGVPTSPVGGPGGQGGGTIELNSPNLPPGANYQHRFTAAGTFRYYCIYHTPMTGSVVVDSSAADTLATVNIANSTGPFAPAS